jgi:DNA N-6-adenine-methyltransferase (Dam)
MLIDLGREDWMLPDALPPDLATAEATLKANLGHLRQWMPTESSTANQIAAATAVENVIIIAAKQQKGWSKMRLIGLRELGLYLLRAPRLKRGRPQKGQHGLLPSLADLGIKDNHIATRALNVAKISEELFNAYLTRDEPTEGGLLKLAETGRVSREIIGGFLHDHPKGEAKYLASRATSDNVEWYTPERVFAALGCQFDLDVASPGADVVPWLPADRHFTLADNGLERDWGDAFVWMNAPHGRGTLPQWLEKFQQHANGIALVVDRTSAGWWHDLCGNANLILQVNKRIDFLRPDDEPGTNALGSTLVAYGERAVQALKNAAAAGLGALFAPVHSGPTGASLPECETRRVENYSESENQNAVPLPPQPQVWRTPPEIYKQLEAEFGPFDFDATPHPRPPGFNSLVVPWGRRTFCNGPYSARRNPEGYGPTDFARKAIDENRLGKTIVFLAPVFNYVSLLLEAGAEARSLGRVQFEAETGQVSAPMFITCFVLWSNRSRT